MREWKELKGITCDFEPQLSILDIKMYNNDGSKACDELKSHGTENTIVHITHSDWLWIAGRINGDVDGILENPAWKLTDWSRLKLTFLEV